MGSRMKQRKLLLQREKKVGPVGDGDGAEALKMTTTSSEGQGMEEGGVEGEKETETWIEGGNRSGDAQRKGGKNP